MNKNLLPSLIASVTILFSLSANAEKMEIKIIYPDGKIVTSAQGSIDLNYPPFGEKTVFLRMGEKNEGIPISKDEYLARQAIPHMTLNFVGQETPQYATSSGVQFATDNISDDSSRRQASNNWASHQMKVGEREGKIATQQYSGSRSGSRSGFSSGSGSGSSSGTSSNGGPMETHTKTYDGKGGVTETIRSKITHSTTTYNGSGAIVGYSTGN